jgi:ABC-2 type transport system permease protein
MMWRQLRVLLRKEFTHLRRDPVILRLLLVMPIIQLVVLANAATFEVKTAGLWVVDQDRSSEAAGLVDALTAAGRFLVVGRSPTAEAGDAALRRGDAGVMLVVPRAFARDLVREGRGTVHLVFDAVNGAQAGALQGYAAQIIAQYAPTLARPGAGAARRAPEIRIESRSWYNPSLTYRHFMIPGVLAQLVTMVGTLMTALNIVREKEVGTLDQLNVTPVRPALFLAAKLIPLWVTGMFVFSLGVLIGRFGFGVPFVGNPAVLFAGAALYLIAALGVGLWISTMAETQQQALFVTFALIMVYILMSGLFTPVRGMPDWARTVAQVNPLLHFIALVRAVMLKGAGWQDVAVRLSALGAIGGVIMVLAIRRYRKQSA